ncbi:hypothetical protein E2C01_052756 [Portunus trituberculatus]|uniref:Uncharacterized protein n=1 Tax=Portunus trituberculatus TaxID=210409 RepID=A0A5B7GNC6_PORTR|nr:hypothetical protein [Portunus trituberculatus]
MEGKREREGGKLNCGCWVLMAGRRRRQPLCKYVGDKEYDRVSSCDMDSQTRKEASIAMSGTRKRVQEA